MSSTDQIIPPGWEAVPLKQLMSFQNGFNANKSAYGHGVPFANVLEVIHNSHFDHRAIPGRVSVTPDALQRFLVKKGDVLFNRTSETQEEVGLASTYQGDEPVVFGGFVVRGRISGNNLDPTFAGYGLRSPIVRKQIMSAGQGGIRANIGQKNLGEVQIALPPPEEQSAIVEALNDISGLISSLASMIAKKRDLKIGAMQDLLNGRRRLPGFSGNWSHKKFSDISRIRNQKIQTLSDDRAEHCIELEQMEGRTGRLRYWISAADRSTSKYLFAPGDVLFGRLRPYLRKYYLADTEGVCSTEIWPLMATGVAPGFLYHVVQSELFIAAACESYGTHMPRADWGKLLTFELDVPDDPEEQDAIGSVLLDMDAEVQVLERRLHKALEVKEGMMEDLLTGRVRLGPMSKANNRMEAAE
jgi:type I restriction enzyme S subunit